MNFNNIPRDLKGNSLWCVWKREERNGRNTKIPYNPRTLERAKSNDPNTFLIIKQHMRYSLTEVMTA